MQINDMKYSFCRILFFFLLVYSYPSIASISYLNWSTNKYSKFTNYFEGLIDSSGIRKKEANLNSEENAGLKLPAGFSALLVADKIGPARHLAVSSKGNIYIKLADSSANSSIKVYGNIGKNGESNLIQSFADYGGTGIAIKNGFLYASSNTDIYRYHLDPDGKITNPKTPDHLVYGLLERGEHESKSITLDNAGNIYVNIGAYSNACQIQDRQKGSPSYDPCPILDSAGGIWRFKADVLNQTYKEGLHYGKGIRNVVGLDWNTQTNQLFVMQHGRDQLHDMFPDRYNFKSSAELPAEEMFIVKPGKEYGWPYCYYDPMQHKKVLSPEYGGDGKIVGRCANAENPVISFPAHMAPNGLLFYKGNMFPEKYKNGAFIAFHGSWNRAPEPQKGYFVVFVPFENGKPTGKWEVFADNFAGIDLVKSPGQAKHRPCGLAEGPDGSLYVSDDHAGSIYRISYNKKL